MVERVFEKLSKADLLGIADVAASEFFSRGDVIAAVRRIKTNTGPFWNVGFVVANVGRALVDLLPEHGIRATTLADLLVSFEGKKSTCPHEAFDRTDSIFGNRHVFEGARDSAYLIARRFLEDWMKRCFGVLPAGAYDVPEDLFWAQSDIPSDAEVADGDIWADRTSVEDESFTSD